MMTARASMLLKLRASLTCSRASFLPGRAKDLSALRYLLIPSISNLVVGCGWSLNPIDIEGLNKASVISSRIQ